MDHTNGHTGWTQIHINGHVGGYSSDNNRRWDYPAAPTTQSTFQQSDSMRMDQADFTKAPPTGPFAGAGQHTIPVAGVNRNLAYLDPRNPSYAHQSQVSARALRDPVMFPGASDFQILGGNFNNVAGDQHIYHNTDNEDGKYLDELDPKYAISDPLRCLDGTRRDIISKIKSWSNEFNRPNILWLDAYPGAGKSTIASTVAKELNEEHRPTIMFAFNAQDGFGSSILWRFFAHELARLSDVCRLIIISKLKELRLSNLTAKDIFHHLIDEPLQQLAKSLQNNEREHLFVFVIDGLDECGGLEGLRSADRESLHACIAGWAKLPAVFKLVVTSRIQDDIQALFNGNPHSYTFPGIPHQSLRIATGDAVSEESTHDIRLYFRNGFRKLADRYRLPADWPGTDTLDELTSHAAGIFSWASTALKYIEVNPEGRLSDVRAGSLPAGDLSTLYSQIVTKSFSCWKDDECAKIRTFVTAVGATRVSLTLSDFERALNFNRSTVRSIYEGLRPLLQDGVVLRFIHQSFVDFLSGRTKNQTALCPEQFRINPNELLHLVETFAEFFERKFTADHHRLEYINNMVAAQQQIIDLISNDHVEKPMFLDDLGRILYVRYRRLGEIKDIQQIVVTLQQALDLSSDRHIRTLGFRATWILSYLRNRLLRNQQPLIVLTGSNVPKNLNQLPCCPVDASRLAGLTQALLLRFTRLGHLEDIEDVVRLDRHLAEATKQPMHFFSLGIALRVRYMRLGKLEDIEDSIVALQRAATLTPEGHVSKPLCLRNLEFSRRLHSGHIGESRDAVPTLRRTAQLTNRVGKRGYLDRVRGALQLRLNRFFLRNNDTTYHTTLSAPVDEMGKPVVLNDLGSVLQARFEQLGEYRDIDEAIVMFRRAMELVPEGHPHNEAYLCHLGEAFLARFQRSGKPGDIEDAIAALYEGIDLTPREDGHKPRYLNSLALALTSRFTRLGEIRDVENAITALRQAVALTPDDDANKPRYLRGLGAALSIRFYHLGDLKGSKNATAALQRITGLPGVYRLKTVGDTLQSCFRQSDRHKLVAEEILISRRASDLTPVDHPGKPWHLLDLATALQNTFGYFGRLRDLDDAIAVLHHANELTPDHHVVKPACLLDLGRALCHRFYHQGEAKDIEDSIALFHRLNQLIPDHGPAKPIQLESLGMALTTRFEHFGEPKDIDDAVLALHQANELTPDDRPDKQSRLHNLGHTLTIYFNHFGQPKDIEDSISMLRRADVLLPDSRIERSAILDSLGVALQSRFRCYGELKDIDDAIVALYRANALLPTTHGQKPNSLYNLGLAFKARFERFGESSDMEEAISLLRSAVKLVPDGHKKKSTYIHDLKEALEIHARLGRP